MADTFITFSANGTTWSFTFPFPYDTNDEIVVGRRIADDTYETLMESDGFRIVKNPDADGGKVQFGHYEGATWIEEPLDAGIVLKVSRNTKPVSELTPESPMTKEQILDEFTKCLRAIAECKDDLENNVLRKFPTSFTLALQELVAADANKILIYDLTEDKIKTTDFTKDQVVITSEGNSLWLRVEHSESGIPILQFSEDQGNTWNSAGSGALVEHNELPGRAELDCHPLLGITGGGNPADLSPSDAGVFPNDLVQAINAERTDRHAGTVAKTDIDNQTPVDPQADRVPSTQLMVKRVFSTKPKLTGVISESWMLGQKIVELPDGSGLNVPAFQIFVNKTPYYGVDESDFAIVQFQDRPWLIPNMGSGTQKAFYLYATIDGQVIYSDISPYGYLGEDRCWLGSGFAIKDGSVWKIQPGTWESQVWDTNSSKELRMDHLNRVGLVNFQPIGSAQPLQMKLDAFVINGEGINFENRREDPNTITMPAQDPNTFTRIYPGYAGQETPTSDWSTLNKWYNRDTGLLEDVPVGAVSVVVEFTTPAGQNLKLLQQGTNAKVGYFPGIGEALLGMPNLQYELNNISSRIIPMGMSWGVTSGLTDVSDPLQLSPYQSVPASLKVYGDTASGGSNSPVSGITVRDKDGNQIGATGAGRELQATKNVKLTLAGATIKVESPDPLDDVNAAQVREIQRNDNAKAGDTGYAKGTMVIANVNESDDMDYVIESSPRGSNPWYRKWKSGYVEQGGYQAFVRSIGAGLSGEGDATFPVPMQLGYTANAINVDSSFFHMSFNKGASTTTVLSVAFRNNTSSSASTVGFAWTAYGWAL